MPSGTACELLLLHWGPAVALAMYAIARLTLLASGAVPLPVTLLTIHKTRVVVVSMVLHDSRTSGLGTLA